MNFMEISQTIVKSHFAQVFNTLFLKSQLLSKSIVIHKKKLMVKQFLILLWRNGFLLKLVKESVAEITSFIYFSIKYTTS